MAAKVKDRSAKARGLKLVSFEIDAELWKDFKIHAIRAEKTGSELIRELIHTEMKAKKKVR